jgi:hypothetical protein
LAELQRENERLRTHSEPEGLKTGGGGGTSDPMDLVTCRLDQYAKRAKTADACMALIETKLGAIQLTLAGMATKDSIRNWGLAVIAIVIATGVGMGAIMLQASGNQLSAFQSGLSSVQAIVSASQVNQLSQPTWAPETRRAEKQ